MFNTNNEDLLVRISSHSDYRGNLYVIQKDGQQLPFDIQRVFWIKDIPKNATRGLHAHRTCWELLIVIKGTVKVTLENQNANKFILNDSKQGLLIPPMTWCKLYDFSNDAICLCLASECYDELGYIHSYEVFKKVLLDASR